MNSPEKPKIDQNETRYLLESVNKYFKRKISEDDIVDTYSGIRPLIEEFKEATNLTRDYIFDVNIDKKSSPLLIIYGGKLTTYRKLADNVFKELKSYLPLHTKKSWTHKRKLL